jgi:bis(5'-nucleosidyl)-tetraphosphatase
VHPLLHQIVTHLIRDDKPKITAAGFILVRQEEDGSFKVLGLLQPGGFDMPKGHLEPGEELLEGAIRETKEEVGITDVGMPWGKDYILVNTLAMFIGITKQSGKISPNPETGQLEHLKIRWMTFDEMMNRCHDYLIPAVRWGKSVVEG